MINPYFVFDKILSVCVNNHKCNRVLLSGIFRIQKNTGTVEAVSLDKNSCKRSQEDLTSNGCRLASPMELCFIKEENYTRNISFVRSRTCSCVLC